jgi:hypothetical protein
MTTKLPTTKTPIQKTRKAPAPVKVSNQRVSEYDRYMVEQRKRHLNARARRMALDLDLAEANANVQALQIERADWAAVEESTALIIAATAPRQAPQLTVRDQADDPGREEMLRHGSQT